MVVSIKVKSMSRTVNKSKEIKNDYVVHEIGMANIDVLDAAYHTAHSYPGGVPALAVRMVVNPNTLMSKVDPSKTTHLLGLKEAVAIQAMTGDKRITHAMAAALGGVFIEIDSNESGCSLKDVSKMISEFGETITEMQKAASDGVVTQNEMAKCEKEVADLFAAANNALRSLRSMMSRRD